MMDGWEEKRRQGGRQEGRQTDGLMGRRMNGVVGPCLSHDRG